MAEVALSTFGEQLARPKVRSRGVADQDHQRGRHHPGASDDDPSGIGTYSQVGSQFGYNLLWTALFTFPLMAAMQELCARIALHTGVGLGIALRRKFPTVLVGICILALFCANTRDEAGAEDLEEALGAPAPCLLEGRAAAGRRLVAALVALEQLVDGRLNVRPGLHLVQDRVLDWRP